MSRNKKKKQTQQCFPTCNYFPDMSCNEGDYKMDKNGVKYRNPPQVFRCCFDNHIISWNTPCPLKLVGGKCELQPFEFNNDYLTEFEVEHRQNMN